MQQFAGALSVDLTPALSHPHGWVSAGLNILLPNISIHMKRIYRFGEKGYVHLDSYPENYETHPINFSNFIFSLVVAAIACTTAGAMLGVDITDPQVWNNGNARSTGR